MAEEFVLKIDYSDSSDAEAVLIHWIYEPGAMVHQGEIIAEAMVDKVSLTIEAPRDGYLRPMIHENETFISGQPIAEISTEPPRREATNIVKDTNSIDLTSPYDFVPASPRVRKYAKEKGINLKDVAEVTSHRPLTIEDIDAWLERQESQGMTEYSPFRQRLIQNLTDPGALPTTLQRRIIAGNAQWSPLVRIAWAVDQALKTHPEIHGWATADGFVRATELKLGIATATSQGLIVPVIRGSYDLEGWKTKLEELRQAVNKGVWNRFDFSQPSFIISNLGPWGIEYFTPRLMVPTVAILGIGMGNSDTFPVSLTFDHRVLDGVDAAEFLVTVDKVLRGSV
ncbi:2-oxo acid dehydrogenase subunit E2 [Sulfobacillus thermosulfidooxidans]|uniref:2-oxo acid dehydrogenase subunit E2 n=1 Tax=Sulfobacillus thermosulfidooxidans TaxID=28034 RepID=UPI000317FF36|nr:2-oxo acid dehydrogenase subunit E2 [Sulfobacillus thermosulfidooxidans]